MKKIKYILIIISGGLFNTTLDAQARPQKESNDEIKTAKYATAIGLRGGFTSGLTIKQFTSETMAIEGIVGFWPYAISITGLLEFYKPAGIDGMAWYYGFGGHIATETGRIYYRQKNGMNRYERTNYREGALGLGVDGILGLEYKIPPIPFALSIDLKPFLEINTAGRAMIALDPGIGVKFAF